MTIFPEPGLHTRWEDHLYDLTPVERRGGLYFKREDAFAPLGSGGLNGGKLRQCIHLLYWAQRRGATGVISAASVKSPQISMSTAVAKHFDMDAVQVIGATTPRAALKHENVAIAARLGARFAVNSVAYNPALQRRARAELEAAAPGRYYLLPYGISIPDAAPREEIEAFHYLGANQVRNLPPCDTLILPAGSCNSAASVMYGFARHRPPVRRILLFLIGPNKLVWLERRLHTLGADDVFYWRGKWPPAEAQYLVQCHDLHGTGYVSYQDEVPWTYEGLELHPTYEGKMMRYIHEHLPFLLEGGRACFWVVGSRPTWDAMRPTLPEYDRLPEELPLVA